MLKDHKKIKLNGYELYFPFEPYDVQNDYMSNVLKAVKEGENALLESPTGTGKTLCLLTSAIAALKQERDQDNNKVWDREEETEKSKIIYTSRTFS
jgi:regulator of telomere elongation helicase 1